MLDRRTLLGSSLALTAAAALPSIARAAPLAPFKLYDTHIHLHSADIARYPLRVDISAETKADTIAHPVTPEMVLKMWDETGVEMGCGVTLNFVYFTDNRYLLDMAERFPKRINPIVVLSATDPATPAALKAMAKAYGVSGVRFSGSPDASGTYEFLSDAASAAWEMANDLGLAVVLLVVRPPEAQAAALPAAMKRVGELAAKYSKVSIVLDHVGFPVAAKTSTFGFSPEHLALAGHKNIFFKYTTFIMAQFQTTGVPLNEFLSYAVGVYGADQFVWGSAFGNNEIGRRGQFVGGDAMRNPEGYKQIVKLALDSASSLSLAQKKALFYSTAKRVFVPGGAKGRG